MGHRRGIPINVMQSGRGLPLEEKSAREPAVQQAEKDNLLAGKGGCIMKKVHVRKEGRGVQLVEGDLPIMVTVIGKKGLLILRGKERNQGEKQSFSLRGSGFSGWAKKGEKGLQKSVRQEVNQIGGRGLYRGSEQRGGGFFPDRPLGFPGAGKLFCGFPLGVQSKNHKEGAV